MGVEHVEVWNPHNPISLQPFELEVEGLNSQAGQAEEPEIGEVEFQLRDVLVAKLADGTGAVREDGVDGS